MQNPAKFSQNSNLYSSRSYKAIDLDVNRKYTCNFLLVTDSNFWCISYNFRDIDAFSFKIACFPTPPLFDAPARGNPLEFLDETYLAKTRGMGLPYGEMVKVS